MIEFKRAYGVYCHWAVYIANGYVVNYGRKDPTPAIVQKEKLIIKVAEDCPCRINNLTGAASDLNLTPFPRDEIVERTLAKVGKKYEYKLSKNNCECFATECRYGTGFTCQPTEAVIAAGHAMGGGALGYEAGKRAVASGNWTEEEVADYLYDSWSNSAFY